MALVNNVIINIYSVILLFVIYHHSKRQNRNEFLQFKIYNVMLWITIFMLGIDILSRFDGGAGRFFQIISRTGNFLIFVLNPILPSLWLLYAHCVVFPKKRIDQRLIALLLAVNVVHAVLVILTQYTGWLYYFSQDNVYQRGPLFWLSVLITAAILLASVVFLTTHRRRLGGQKYYSMLLFLLPPLVGIVLQVAFYGISLVLNSVVISFLIVLLNIQNRDIYTDYLTEINNRKKFDAYLQQKIVSARDGRTFSAIMLDLNNFKVINDTLGHDMGDDALQTAVRLFLSCIDKTDFIARLGGDEFCIISDISCESELKTLAGKISSCLAEFNESGRRPYKLSVSMGYAVYDCRSGMTMAEFMKHIDCLMYDSKNLNKNHSDCEPVLQ